MRQAPTIPLLEVLPFAALAAYVLRLMPCSISGVRLLCEISAVPRRHSEEELRRTLVAKCAIILRAIKVVFQKDTALSTGCWHAPV